MKATANNFATFAAGTSYTMTFIGDSELFVEMHVIRRTEKSVWVQEVRNGKLSGEVQRKQIKHSSDSEYIVAGSYSMAPSTYARHEWTAKTGRPAYNAAPVVEEEVEEVPVVEEVAPVVEEVVENINKPVAAEITTKQMEESDHTVEETRVQFAETDVKIMEHNGPLFICGTVYGNVEISREFGKYWAKGEEISFTTPDRGAFLTFVASLYVIVDNSPEEATVEESTTESVDVDEELIEAAFRAVDRREKRYTNTGLNYHREHMEGMLAVLAELGLEARYTERRKAKK